MAISKLTGLTQVQLDDICGRLRGSRLKRNMELCCNHLHLLQGGKQCYLGFQLNLSLKSKLPNKLSHVDHRALLHY